MAAPKTRTVESLIHDEAWDEARALIERELTKQPDDHWLLTQLGVTYYEQGRYRDALRPLLASLEIVSDCPLTLWNLAGTLDALGKPKVALRIYVWLLRSKKTAEVDPCWESAAWADALKTDCVYRAGVCFEHLGRRESAANCFRQYINLVLAGMNGTYPVEDAARHVRELNGKGPHKHDKDVRAAITSTLREPGVRSIQSAGRTLPKLSLAELLAG
jgi:tetratricopeptide (TPR) repeat protein